jgi:hypothetical protein
VAPHELTVRYEGRMRVYAGSQPLTQAPVYEELEEHVQCVGPARIHARQARVAGHARRGLAWAGGTLGVAGLGGLGGLALLESDPRSAFAILGLGIGFAALGVTLAAISRTQGHASHGHAVDAVNYYNDAVGSLGGHCGPGVGATPSRAVGVPAPQPAPTMGPQPPPEPPAAVPAAQAPNLLPVMELVPSAATPAPTGDPSPPAEPPP